jgi:transposase
LSLVVSGANVHDCKRLDDVLTAIVVKRKDPPHRRNKHLCADAGYRGAKHLRTIEDHGYIPHVVGRRTEADIKQRDPTKKARRWVVEVCHSWFNRFQSCSCATRNSSAASWRSTILPLPSSPSERCPRTST